MAQVEVRDRMIWTKHVHDDEGLRTRLEKTAAEQTVRLTVNGVAGTWRKVKDDPTRGPVGAFNPLDEASKRLWSDLFERRRGELVPLAWAESPEQWSDASDAQRDAAWDAFKALTKAGWTSDASGDVDRNDLHER